MRGGESKVMGRILFTLLGAAVLLGAPLAGAQTPPEKPGHTYTYPELFPAEIAGIGFEFPRQGFIELLAARKLNHRANSQANVFAVGVAGAPFTETVYFFNSPACDCLTEIEIRFADEAQALAYFLAKFPKVNIQGEYVAHDGVSTYGVKAWRFKSKVFVVAVVPNTRWANQ
jgi:hypothetical protein